MNSSNSATATVEVLTAEVRVLMVGSRQVTLSVFRQLDYCSPQEIEPFGRVNDASADDDYLRVVGRDDDGVLVMSRIGNSRVHRDSSPEENAEAHRVWDQWAELPLIVLAGLR